MPQELGSPTRNPTDWARTQERDGRGWERCGECGEVKESQASVVDRELSERGGHMHGILERRHMLESNDEQARPKGKNISKPFKDTVIEQRETKRVQNCRSCVRSEGMPPRTVELDM
jgi:hypothetical protein